MATWPQARIPVFPAGYGPLVADFTTWVTGNSGILAQPPVFRAFQESAQAITSTTNTPVQYSTVLEDPYGGWSATATGAQAAWSWLAPYTGLYEITVTNVILAVTAAMEAEYAITGGTPVAMSEIQVTASGPGGTTGSVTVPLTGGFDYVQGIIWVTAAATMASTAGLYSSMEIAYVSG